MAHKDLKIIQDYLNNIERTKIKEKYNISFSQIYRILEKNNIKRKNQSDSKRKYFFDDTYFENINTEEKAYWLGYMYADGCVRINKRDNNKILNLSSIDKEHIEKFTKSLSSNLKIQKSKNVGSFSKNNSIYSVSIYSSKLVDDLIKKGCVLNKTFQLKFPTEEQVPNHLIPHFIRGYFDGDGSISILKHNGNGFIDISGIHNFLIEINNFLNLEKNKYLYKDKRKTTDCWSIKFSSKKTIYLFYDKIYKNSNIFLDRKFKKFEQLQKQRGSTTIISLPNKEEGIV